jgi:hypothetical protein
MFNWNKVAETLRGEINGIETERWCYRKDPLKFEEVRYKVHTRSYSAYLLTRTSVVLIRTPQIISLRIFKVL